MPTVAEMAAQVAAEICKPEYAGLGIDRIVDAMNDPRETGTATEYRAVTAEEVANATPLGLVKIQKAAGDYEAATNAPEQEAALPGALLAARLQMVGSVDVAPESTGRELLDNTVPDFLTAEERDVILVVGVTETPTKATLWQSWGWTRSITRADVEEALTSG